VKILSRELNIKLAPVAGALMALPLAALTLVAPAHAQPMSQANRDFVDATVQASMAKNGNTEYSISITGPAGDYTKSYGISNKTGKVPATVNDHFRIGSSTKTFTANAILRLADQGKLSLNDTIGKYVSGIANGNIITLRQMLMMRSGIFEYSQDTKVKLVMNLIPTWNFSPAGALQVIRSHPASSAPGTKYEYANSNYQLLGMVIEKVTGQPYQTYITNNIIQPLGLTETGMPPATNFQSPTMPAPVAHGYGSPVWGANYDTTKQNPAFYGAAGNMWSTIGDLNKYGNALATNQLHLSSAMQAQRTSLFCGVNTPSMVAPAPQAFGYGLGFISYGRWMGHDGSIAGYGTESFYNKDNGAVIAGFENKQTPSLTALTYVMATVADHLYPGSMATQQYPSC